MKYKYYVRLNAERGIVCRMGGRHAYDRRIYINHACEAAAADVGFKIIKLMVEEKERGIFSDAVCGRKQYSSLRKDKQGR